MHGLHQPLVFDNHNSNYHFIMKYIKKSSSLCNLLLIAIVVGQLISCTSTKNISRSSSTTDSTVITELRDSVIVLKDVISFYETTIKNMDNTAIVFEVDTLYRDTGRVVTNKVIVKADGSIAAEGRIKSLNIEKLKEQSLKSYYQEKSDSFAMELDKTKAELRKVQAEKNISKKTIVVPWYCYVLGLPFLILWIREKWFKKRIVRGKDVVIDRMIFPE